MLWSPPVGCGGACIDCKHEMRLFVPPPAGHSPSATPDVQNARSTNAAAAAAVESVVAFVSQRVASRPSRRLVTDGMVKETALGYVNSPKRHAT